MALTPGSIAMTFVGGGSVEVKIIGDDLSRSHEDIGGACNGS